MQNHGRETEHVNKLLLRCYMVMFICELILWIAIMLFFIYIADDHHQIRQVSGKDSQQQCQQVVAFYLFYEAVVLF